VLAGAHDCSDGGLAVALVESAIAGGHGFVVSLASDLPPHVALFAESASRAVVSVASEKEEALLGLAASHDVPAARLGETGGPRVVVDGLLDTTLEELRDAYESAIPRLLGDLA
jgi:phosphoribosylformylglycinamidine (FGAM) synthase-like enzyme